MTRRSVAPLAFAFAGLGFLALALGAMSSVVLGAGWQAPAVAVRQEAPAPGHWTLSTSGALMWTTDAAAAPVPASWSVERSKEIADLQADIDCQIAACASR